MEPGYVEYIVEDLQLGYLLQMRLQDLEFDKAAH
jgi:hypothetical protein